MAFPWAHRRGHFLYVSWTCNSPRGFYTYQKVNISFYKSKTTTCVFHGLALKLPIYLIAWFTVIRSYCHCSFIGQMCLNAAAWALLQTPGETEMNPTWPCPQNSHLQRFVNSHLPQSMTKTPVVMHSSRIGISQLVVGGVREDFREKVSLGPQGLPEA